MATQKKQQPADPPTDVEVEVVETVVLDEPTIVKPEPEPEVFDALVSSHGRLIETPVDPGAPPLYGFEEEPPKDSSILLDEPDPAPPTDDPIEVIGSFVGFGVEQVSRADGEWLVDPATGRITGPV